jgi:hypothetical protein
VSFISRSIHDAKDSVTRTQDAVAKNPRPQSTHPAQGLLRALTERVVHPVAGLALTGAVKEHSLNFEVMTNESIQVQTTHDYVAPRLGDRLALDLKALAKSFENLLGEKGDLPLVVFHIVKKAVTTNSPTRHALRFLHRQTWSLTWRQSVVPVEVVIWRNVNAGDDHRLTEKGNVPCFLTDALHHRCTQVSLPDSKSQGGEAFQKICIKRGGIVISYKWSHERILNVSQTGP